MMDGWLQCSWIRFEKRLRSGNGMSDQKMYGTMTGGKVGRIFVVVLERFRKLYDRYAIG